MRRKRKTELKRMRIRSEASNPTSPSGHVFDPYEAWRKGAPLEAGIKAAVRGDNLAVPAHGQGKIEAVVDASAKPRRDVQSGANEAKGRDRADWEPFEVS